MVSSHPAYSTALLELVNIAVTEAVYLATGYEINSLTHCQVQLSSNYRNSGDMKTNVAASLFLMHTAKKKKEDAVKEQCPCAADPDAPVCSDTSRNPPNAMEVVTTSRYDLKTPRCYPDGECIVRLSSTLP